jgi:excisionase family DNA binding protein
MHEKLPKTNNWVQSKKSSKASSHIPESLWTVKEVARYLQLKPETVRALARRGELPAVKIGKVWRFDRSAIYELTKS